MDDPSTSDLVVAWIAGPLLVLVGGVLVRHRHALSREFRSADRLQHPGPRGERLARTQSPSMAGGVGTAFVLGGLWLVVGIGILRVAT